MFEDKIDNETVDRLPQLKPENVKIENVEGRLSAIRERAENESTFSQRVAKLRSGRLTALDYKETCISSREYSIECTRQFWTRVKSSLEAMYDYQQGRKRLDKTDPRGTINNLVLKHAEKAYDELLEALMSTIRAQEIDWDLNNVLYQTVQDGFGRGFDKRVHEDFEQKVQEVLDGFAALQHAAPGMISEKSLAKAQEKINSITRKEGLMKYDAEEREQLLEEREWLEQFDAKVKELQRWPVARELREFKGKNETKDQVRDRLIKKEVIERIDNTDGSTTWKYKNRELERVAPQGDLTQTDKREA